ncbi:hypothetical protein L6452_46386 [Arctium lappa]|nr:hypothetical protein L6452_46381 [Arctium lappa]KAI3663131.1 hypothetical protein L6452_46386 [Arctium lappa]
MHSATPTKEGKSLIYRPEWFLRLKASKQVGRERNSGVARAPSQGVFVRSRYRKAPPRQLVRGPLSLLSRPPKADNRSKLLLPEGNLTRSFIDSLLTERNRRRQIFLEGQAASSRTRLSNNRSVMPLDVLGRTRATMKVNLRKDHYRILAKAKFYDKNQNDTTVRVPLEARGARLESPRASVVLLKSSGWSLHRFPRKEKALCLAVRLIKDSQRAPSCARQPPDVLPKAADGVVSSGFGSGHTASLVLGVSVWCGGLHFSPSRTSRPVGMFRSLAPGGARAGAWPCAALLFARTRGDLIGARRYQSLGRGRTEDAFDGRFGLHSDRPAPAGRWPWKSESAKECVTTHLPKQLALKMDGAEASCLYSAVRAREAGLVRHEALTSRRVASVCAEGSGREPAWSRRRCRSWW